MSTALGIQYTDPEKAYLCHSPPVGKFSKKVNDILYEADWKFTDIHLQAFGVKDNKFSAG